MTDRYIPKRPKPDWHYKIKPTIAWLACWAFWAFIIVDLYMLTACTIDTEVGHRTKTGTIAETAWDNRTTPLLDHQQSALRYGQ